MLSQKSRVGVDNFSAEHANPLALKVPQGELTVNFSDTFSAFFKRRYNIFYSGRVFGSFWKNSKLNSPKPLPLGARSNGKGNLGTV